MSDDIIWVDGFIPDEEIDMYSNFNNVYDAVIRVKDLIDSGEWKEVYVDVDNYYDGTPSGLKFRGKRRETDKERAERIKQLEKNLAAAKKAEKTKELNERKEYERLKKKFEAK